MPGLDIMRGCATLVVTSPLEYTNKELKRRNKVKLSVREIKQPHKRSDRLVSNDLLLKFKMNAKKSSRLPFRLLGKYVEATGLDSLTLENVYAKIRNGDRSVVSDIKTIAAMEKAKINCVNDVARFRALYQAEKLLAKYPFTGDKDNCRRNAISRFLEAENMCKTTNDRLRSRRHHISEELPDLYDIHHNARKIIAQILGSLDISRLVDGNRTGPGLSYTLNKGNAKETTLYFKYAREQSVTREAHLFGCGMIARDVHWMETLGEVTSSGCPLVRNLKSDTKTLGLAVKLIAGNRITFVPKDCTTDRAIAIEPSLNIMLQLGVGTHIKDRLNLWGINLRDQNRNRHMAYLGSLANQENPLCTIDLRMASDTISLETVRTLLPGDWFDYLYKLRSQSGVLTRLDGEKETVLYEKFSSMGNGFTFELESLIFFALTLATRNSVRPDATKDHRADISIFGDDIICRQSDVKQLTHVLNHYGFEINQDKSFVDGPFRESCGSDFLLGIDVRPFSLKREVANLSDLHFVCNSLMYKGISQKTTLHHDAYSMLFSCIPNRHVLPGPMVFDIGKPMKYEKDDYNALKRQLTLSLESNLRAPLSWALSNGFYKLSPAYHCMVVPTLSVLAPKHTKEYVRDKGFSAGRYQIFLQGVLSGDIILRNNTLRKIRFEPCSRWDIDKQEDKRFIPPDFY